MPYIIHGRENTHFLSTFRAPGDAPDRNEVTQVKSDKLEMVSRDRLRQMLSNNEVNDEAEVYWIGALDGKMRLDRVETSSWLERRQAEDAQALIDELADADRLAARHATRLAEAEAEANKANTSQPTRS